MPLWAPLSYEQACLYLKVIDKTVKPPVGKDDLAEWNLSWLFDYDAMRLIDGTVKGITLALHAMNSTAQGAIFTDLKDDMYGIRGMAESLGPVEFINTLMRKPYRTTTLFTMCGEGIFTQARTSAEKLALTMVGRAEVAQEAASKVIHNAKVIAFPSRK